MNTSPQGRELLIKREGKRNTVYLDSQGKPTVGVGHMDESLVVGDVWTDEQVEEALATDLERSENAINDAVTVPLEQHQFDALISWAFNVGTGWVSDKSDLIRKLNAGDLDGAAEGFDHFHSPPEIISRRNGEREQFKGTQYEARIA